MIVVDTGILLAVANRNDRWHARAVEVLVEHRAEMLVPAPVVIETAWLIARDLGNTAEAAFVAAAGRGEFRIVDLTATDYRRASENLTTYADNNFGRRLRDGSRRTPPHDHDRDRQPARLPHRSARPLRRLHRHPLTPPRAHGSQRWHRCSATQRGRRRSGASLGLQRNPSLLVPTT